MTVLLILLSVYAVGLVPLALIVFSKPRYRDIETNLILLGLTLGWPITVPLVAVTRWCERRRERDEHETDA